MTVMRILEKIEKLHPHCSYHVDIPLGTLDDSLAHYKVDMDPEDYRAHLVGRNVPKIGQMSLVKRHVACQQAQSGLRDAIALWAGHQRAALRPDSESYRRFYFMFGIDVLSAQALGTTEAAELAESVRGQLA